MKPNTQLKCIQQELGVVITTYTSLFTFQVVFLSISHAEKILSAEAEKLPHQSKRVNWFDKKLNPATI